MGSEFAEQVTVRPATIEDADSLAVLCSQLGYPSAPSDIDSRLQDLQAKHDHIVYVAHLRDGRVVGWSHAHQCHLVIAPPQILVLGLIVDANYHHRGVGRLLMQHIEQWALAKGCSSVLLRSNIVRREAHQFYERIGYINTKQSLVFYKELT
ncbi:MAG: GNAT family N-acetyltransferase [Leptolyngbyaceae cyanobacterium RU_5_1]|nr:GNAT family N-acetyltransferase [Leptolyngbyaceae cyanobacterium RU_5_1]